jgi:hypothetical protein
MDGEKAMVVSALWHSLEKAGDKLKDQKVREVLPAGGKIPVSLRVEGRVDGASLAVAVNGHLQIAHDGTTNKKRLPDPGTALALLLQHVPKTRRRKALDQVQRRLVTVDEADLVPEADVAECTALLVAATSIESTARRGAVSFEFC